MHVLPLISALSKQSFDFDYVIGENRFGYVWKAKYKETGVYYAVKQMKKEEIFKQRAIDMIKKEKEMLARLRHPYIANIYFAF